MNDLFLAPDQTIAQILQNHPQTARVFVAFKTECVGCYLMRFCSLDYIARSYNLDLEILQAELQKAILSGQ